MPSGMTPTLLNRKPAYIGDDTSFSSINLTGVGPGTTAPTLRGGFIRSVVNAAATLTAAQSGSLCLWPAAAGFTYTLPAPVVGLWFEFANVITNTSVVCKIITDASTTFLLGSVYTAVIATTPGATPGPKAFAFDGSSHVACNMGGTDTTMGGVTGSRIRVECITATQWLISGNIIAAGTIATPAGTS